MTDSLIERQNNFSKTLLDWFFKNKRELPWRENPDPYHVWLSEIILQQTRVAQGLPYFNAFIEAFPKIENLAEAPEEYVLRLWQGLGYYSRARNLHHTAKTIVEKYDGVFPGSFEEIISLKGIGPYTAAAIASICFKEPVPVIDGNVFRFASRVFGIEDDISLAKSRKVFDNILRELIDSSAPGDFNQAMMEMGALICKPINPSCEICDFRLICYARKNNLQSSFPVKTKKLKVKERSFKYLVWKFEDQLAMRKRNGNDIWAGLYDFEMQEIGLGNIAEEPSSNYETINETKEYVHLLSHQKIKATFELRELSSRVEFEAILENGKLSAFSMEEIVTLPKPKLIVNYLNELAL